VKRAVVSVYDGAAEGVFVAQSRFTRVVRGVPDGARLMSVERDPRLGRTLFVFEHESFVDVREGYPYPEIPIHLEARTIEAQA